jgi:hypothetical protein
MKHNFIKKHWLKISIILFTCFIIIPVILNIFKLYEGIDETIVDGTNNVGTTIDGTNNVGTTIDGTNNIGPNFNNNIPFFEPNPFDIELNSKSEFITQLNQFGHNIPLTESQQQINHNLNTIYKINKDLSNNVYRKSDSVKDLYDTSGKNMLNNILSQLSGLSTKIDDIKKEETPIEDIKCIADFGTNIGDDLCCGQSGILTDTKYVCPENYSKCDNMKCGSKYGTCVKA